MVGETGRYALRSLGDRRARRGHAVRRRAAPTAGRPGGAGAGLPGRRRHARADGARRCGARASAPTAPTSTPTSAAPSTPPPSSRRGSSRSRSGAAAGCRSSGTAWAACSPAASPYAVPTWSPAIVTLGSPMLAPGAHHRALTASVDVLVRLSRAGVPGLMSEDCVAGRCARQSFEESRAAAAGGRRLHRDLLQARRHRRLAGLRRPARASRSRSPPRTSGMAFDPRVIDRRRSRLLRTVRASVLEVDRGESA